MMSGPRTPPSTVTHGEEQQSTTPGGVMGSLRVIELQLVAFIMVFSMSGLVPFFDIVFPALTSLYLLLLARFAFPPTSTSTSLFHGSALFRAYVVFGTTVGLFLPLAYVLGGFARGDEHAVRSATPHLFLLSFQILTENVVGGFGAVFSPPVRALVPVLYTGRRVFVLLDWVCDVWFVDERVGKEVPWLWFGKGLAATNLAYFSVNLFGFLIPRFLPRAFERYFRERDELHAKMTEDKRSPPAAAAAEVEKKKKSRERKKSE